MTPTGILYLIFYLVAIVVFFKRLIKNDNF